MQQFVKHEAEMQSVLIEKNYEISRLETAVTAANKECDDLRTAIHDYLDAYKNSSEGGKAKTIVLVARKRMAFRSSYKK